MYSITRLDFGFWEGINGVGTINVSLTGSEPRTHHDRWVPCILRYLRYVYEWQSQWADPSLPRSGLPPVATHRSNRGHYHISFSFSCKMQCIVVPVHQNRLGIPPRPFGRVSQTVQSQSHPSASSGSTRLKGQVGRINRDKLSTYLLHRESPHTCAYASLSRLWVR